MNTSLAAPMPTAPAPGLYQRLVLEAFQRMSQGCLELTLPDGEQRVIGTPGAPVTARIQILSPRFFRRCVLHGDIGFGESYVEGEWETNSIERVIAWAILNVDTSPAMSGSPVHSLTLNLLRGINRIRHLLRPNSLATARRNISEHYDLGNAFYQLWLDPGMTYSSALFSHPDESLESAQTAKYEALCRKLQLSASDHLLEIGSGWGGFASHAARTRGCRITTITLSREQHAYTQDRMRREGLADQVEVLLEDYRKVEGRFDRIVSIEMMEALGDRYLKTFFTRLHALLRPNGLVGLQFITVPDSRHAELRHGVDWIQKHIFPGSLLLSLGRITEAVNATGTLSLQQYEDFGASYARTLRAWHQAFNARLPEVRALGFDDRFIRKWNYYLQYCEAAFGMHNIGVAQAVYSRPNNPHLSAS